MKLKKVDDKTAYENLLVKYAELENKIADIKANCDFAIEGRDIKIKELEEQVANLEGIKLAQETALNTEYNIKECLIKENAELKERYNKVDIIGYDALKNLTKAKEVIKSSVVLLTKSRTALDTKTYLMKAEKFIKEIEK